MFFYSVHSLVPLHVMFKGIKNLASEIHNDFDDIRHNSSHSVTHSISSTTSKTKRFLKRSSGDNTGTPTGIDNSAGSSTFSIRHRKKEWEEIDGKGEDETVVHKALLRYFKEQGHTLPPYLRSGTGRTFGSDAAGDSSGEFGGRFARSRSNRSIASSAGGGKAASIGAPVGLVTPVAMEKTLSESRSKQEDRRVITRTSTEPVMRYGSSLNNSSTDGNGNSFSNVQHTPPLNHHQSMSTIPRRVSGSPNGGSGVGAANSSANGLSSRSISRFHSRFGGNSQSHLQTLSPGSSGPIDTSGDTTITPHPGLSRAGTGMSQTRFGKKG